MIYALATAFLNATWIFFLLALGVLFKIVAWQTPSPSEKEPLKLSLQRLWGAYCAEIRRAVVSPWLWGIAALWTGLILALTLLPFYKLPN